MGLPEGVDSLWRKARPAPWWARSTEVFGHGSRQEGKGIEGMGISERSGRISLQGVEIHLSHPDELSLSWVGQVECLKQLLAAWWVVGPEDMPMNPRLVGRPGVGKTTLAYAAGRALKREVYIFQATMDTRPEDLLITPVISSEARIKYVASPLVTAMVRGGVCVLDEGNRMSEKAWASLAPLLDPRRYVESIVTGLKIQAHPDFRFVATMNEDASTYELPEYIHSRLQPQILVDFPDREDELRILKENLPFADPQILQYVVDFLQRAHEADERYTVRDGINVARYALKLAGQEGGEIRGLIRKGLLMILGEEALPYLE